MTGKKFYKEIRISKKELKKKLKEIFRKYGIRPIYNKEQR